MTAIVLLLAAAATASPPPPLGVNIIDALWSVWASGSPGAAHTAAAASSACASRALTTIRFAATPYWPDDLSQWRTNATAYWASADAGMAALTGGGCTRLVPSLFFNIWAMADLFQEPLGALAIGAAGGPSAAFSACLAYIDQFVGRYAHLPQIAAWELANEVNLLFDLDQSTMCNNCVPARGSPGVRTRADNVSTADGDAVWRAFAARVRAADGGPQRSRPVSSGHSKARPSAEHLRASYHAPGRDWGLDTEAQFAANFALQQGCCEWASAHIYPGADSARWGKTGENDATILLYLQAAAAEAGRARELPLQLYIGEFGALPTGPANDPNAPRPFVDAFLNLLGEGASTPPPGVDGMTVAATYWVWEFGGQNGTWALWPGVTDGVIASLERYVRQ